MKGDESSVQKTIEIFRASWDELAEEYASKRPGLVYLCEGDIQLHLARKLLDRMPNSYVHINLPIPIEVKRFYSELELFGRPIASPKEHIKPDIVITDEFFLPCLICEIKFTPLYFGFIPSWIIISKLEKGEKVEDREKEELRRSLAEIISNLQRLHMEGPSERDVDYYLSNIDKVITIVKSFKKEEDVDVAGYLCVIDELFPDLEERLKQVVKKHDPPTQLEILVEHFDLIEPLEQIRKKIV